tara:strand:- start:3765 stop:3956 length:192 start_codon:yes stop_codon:yes gene_type:complete
MPDITMCEGKDCPLKEKCYLYKAIPNPYRQSYFMSIPYDPIDKDCDYFFPIIEGMRIRKEEND